LTRLFSDQNIKINKLLLIRNGSKTKPKGGVFLAAALFLTAGQRIKIKETPLHERSLSAS